MSSLILSGRYQVRQALATGGMGQTFLAEDTHLPGHPVCVVKQLKPDTDNLSFLETAKRLFFSEAETLQKLGTHAQIPRLLAYFEENNEFYLVQEYIEGQPLSQEIVLGQRWSESQVVQLLQDILGILSFVHHQDVIHRDLKPDNLIRRQGDQKLVLIDFGAMKQVHSQMGSAVQPNRTVAIGTHGYMPSEQINGRPRMSSDLYAVGKIAIQALTGLLPTQLREDADGELIWRDQANVSEGVAAFLTKMVRDYHKHRYQSSDEALQALQQLTGAAMPSAATPSSVPSPPAYTPTAVAPPTASPSSVASPQPPIAQPPIAQPPIAQPPIAQPPISPAPAVSIESQNAPDNTAALEDAATVMVSPAQSPHGLDPTNTQTAPLAAAKGPTAQKRSGGRTGSPLLVGIGAAALVMILGAIAYTAWQLFPTVQTSSSSSQQTGSGGSQSSGSSKTPEPEEDPDVPENPFEAVAFPLATCGDASVSAPFYRIYISDPSSLNLVSTSYCEDAYIEKKTGGRVKVASFDTEEQAEYFKAFMEEKVGAVEIEVIDN